MWVLKGGLYWVVGCLVRLRRASRYPGLEFGGQALPAPEGLSVLRTAKGMPRQCSLVVGIGARLQAGSKLDMVWT